MSKYNYELTKDEKEFLKNYDASKYPRPSVTSDIVIFTVSPKGDLCVVLVKRKGHPYKGFWALPGGFIQAGKESVGEAAIRELKEETGLDNVFLEQLKTYSDPKRDPRTHVISVAHYALVPYEKIKLIAGDDAEQAKLFSFVKATISVSALDKTFSGYLLKDLDKSDGVYLSEILAFDHYHIIMDALNRLNGRKDYCLDLFSLLSDPNKFMIKEYKQIYDAVSFTKTDKANFRKMFLNRYVKTGIVEDLCIKSSAELYRFIGKKEGFAYESK